jgi:hypothetical protein
MSCCNILTLVLAALTSYFIIYKIPTTPDKGELLRIQRRKALLKLKAGIYHPKALGAPRREP